MTCSEFVTAMNKDETLNEQGIDVDTMMAHLDSCSECGKKYPPLSEDEYFDFISDVFDE